MTKEDKAKEIANKSIVGYGPTYFDVAEESALEMAEWKDQQFKEYLEKKEQELIFGDEMLAGLKLEFLHEIIKELFKED